MNSKPKIVPGIHIQWPWSRLLIDGSKTVETRGYALPAHYRGQELAVIETPGPRGHADGIFDAMIIGTIVFDESFIYETKAAWLGDFDRHQVHPADALYCWKAGKKKWGWRVTAVNKFAKPRPAPEARGIVFTKRCPL